MDDCELGHDTFLWDVLVFEATGFSILAKMVTELGVSLGRLDVKLSKLDV